MIRRALQVSHLFADKNTDEEDLSKEYPDPPFPSAHPPPPVPSLLVTSDDVLNDYTTGGRIIRNYKGKEEQCSNESERRVVVSGAAAERSR